MMDVRACPSWFTLGIPCPGCGLVRATLALATGHPVEAWRLHPLVFVVLPVALVEPLRRWRYPRAAIWSALVMLLGTWVFRLATGAHPDGLHPEEGALARAWGYVAGP